MAIRGRIFTHLNNRISDGWTRGFGEFLKWYVNLEDPLIRSAVGFDYLDNLLDIEVAPDLSAWNFKDEDELDDVVARGMMTSRKADFIRAAGSRVIEELEAKSPPFDEPWHLWRPDPSWDAPCLPDGWNDLSENTACGGDVNFQHQVLTGRVS